jgi:NAD-dependent deacetylase
LSRYRRQENLLARWSDYWAANVMDKEIEQAARLLTQAKYAIALTGAGISTPSGIPDFRSFGSGLWEQVDPFEVATIHAFRQRPQAFYDWVRPLVKVVMDAEPNAAHLALAELGEQGIIKQVITQNIDGLHQRARSEAVIEVHGHLRQATCIRCYTSVPAEPLICDFVETRALPRCTACNGVMKPDVILFGEQLPAHALIAAQQAARKSDVMIVAGSSLEVAPAGDLPLLAKQRGSKLIFVNLGPTHLDDSADVIIRADVVDALPRIVHSVRAGTR